MNLIKVWCEHDISGVFGGNNNEACLVPDNNTTEEEDAEAVLNLLIKRTGLSEEDLEDLWDWEYFSPDVLEYE